MRAILSQKFLQIACLLVALCLTGCREQIVHNLSENEANRLLTRLGNSSLEAEKIKQPDGKWALAVDRSQALSAIKLLDDARLLRENPTEGSDKSSMLSSREDQRFRLERALSHEIEMTLANIPGVLEVRVHLNLPPLDPFFGQPLEKASSASASVFLLARDLQVSKEEIARLVSGASGIPAQTISVIWSRSDAAGTNKENVPLNASAVQEKTEAVRAQPQQSVAENMPQATATSDNAAPEQILKNEMNLGAEKLPDIKKETEDKAAAAAVKNTKLEQSQASSGLHFTVVAVALGLMACGLLILLTIFWLKKMRALEVVNYASGKDSWA